MNHTDHLYDAREKHVFIPAKFDDLPLTLEGYRVYCHLARRVNRDTRTAYPSYNTIGEACFRGSYPNSSAASLKAKAIAAVKELISFGLIRREYYNEGREFKHNIYHLTPAYEWTTPESVESCNVRKGRAGLKRQSVNGDNQVVNQDNREGWLTGNTRVVNGDDQPRLTGNTRVVNGDLPKGTPLKETPIEGTPLKDYEGGKKSKAVQVCLLPDLDPEEPEPSEEVLEDRDSPKNLPTPGTRGKNPEGGDLAPSEISDFEKLQQCYNDRKPTMWARMSSVGTDRSKVFKKLVKEAGGIAHALEMLGGALDYASQDRWYNSKVLSFENFASNNKIPQLYERWQVMRCSPTAAIVSSSPANARLMNTYQNVRQALRGGQ